MELHSRKNDKKTMRTLSGNFFIVGVKYQKTLENGTEASTTEQYLVDALSWTECEARTIDNMSHYTSGELEITSMKKASFNELFLSEVDDEDKYYECVMNFITVDEKTDKEKLSKVRYLVQGKSLENARKNVDEAMKSTMIDYDITSLKETSLMDIFFKE